MKKLLLILAIFSPCAQAVVKCKMDDGRIVYQKRACPTASDRQRFTPGVVNTVGTGQLRYETARRQQNEAQAAYEAAQRAADDELIALRKDSRSPRRSIRDPALDRLDEIWVRQGRY